MDESKYSQLDTLILENLKLQAQIQHLTAHIAALQARLDVHALEAQYTAHVQRIAQESMSNGDANHKL